MKFISSILAFLLSLGAAAAQQTIPGVESVTVNGRKVPDQEIQSFVAKRAAPTFLLGKVARWTVGICPTAMGLKSEFTQFVLQRVRDRAVEAGAPVADPASCKSNIQIIFTTTPQKLMDDVRKKNGPLLGYHDNDDQAVQMARVTHLIQAWYFTETVDVRGQWHPDDGNAPGIGCMDPPGCKTFLPRAHTYAVTGMRTGDGLHSGFHNVMIVINPEKLRGYAIGALADYIAFLALAQPRSQDECATLPSILDLLAPGCAGASDAAELTDSDIGYLRGVYHMTDGAVLERQQNDIAFQVKRALAGKDP